jgi:hypothetical protein
MKLYKDALNQNVYFENEIAVYKPATVKIIDEPTVVEYKQWCEQNQLEPKNEKNLRKFLEILKEEW